MENGSDNQEYLHYTECRIFSLPMYALSFGSHPLTLTFVCWLCESVFTNSILVILNSRESILGGGMSQTVMNNIAMAPISHVSFYSSIQTNSQDVRFVLLRRISVFKVLLFFPPRIIKRSITRRTAQSPTLKYQVVQASRVDMQNHDLVVHSGGSQNTHLLMQFIDIFQLRLGRSETGYCREANVKVTCK